jgi:hypothetical protein
MFTSKHSKYNAVLPFEEKTRKATPTEALTPA